MEPAPAARQRQPWVAERAAEPDAPARRRSHRRLALPHWLLAVADDKWSAQPAVRLLSDAEVEPMRREPCEYVPRDRLRLILVMKASVIAQQIYFQERDLRHIKSSVLRHKCD